MPPPLKTWPSTQEQPNIHMWTLNFQAEEACLNRKGHLASVSSALSNSLLRQAASLSSQKEFWLGGSYDTAIPRRWSWTDERRFSYINWAAGRCSLGTRMERNAGTRILRHQTEYFRHVYYIRHPLNVCVIIGFCSRRHYFASRHVFPYGKDINFLMFAEKRINGHCKKSM